MAMVFVTRKATTHGGRKRSHNGRKKMGEKEIVNLIKKERMQSSEFEGLAVLCIQGNEETVARGENIYQNNKNLCAGNRIVYFMQFSHVEMAKKEG